MRATTKKRRLILEASAYLRSWGARVEVGDPPAVLVGCDGNRISIPIWVLYFEPVGALPILPGLFQKSVDFLILPLLSNPPRNSILVGGLKSRIPSAITIGVAVSASQRREQQRRKQVRTLDPAVVDAAKIAKTTKTATTSFEYVI